MLISEVAWDLITNLVCDPSTRLGRNSKGIEWAKSAPFFQGIENWDQLGTPSGPRPPFVPSLSSPEDTTYFPKSVRLRNSVTLNSQLTLRKSSVAHNSSSSSNSESFERQPFLERLQNVLDSETRNEKMWGEFAFSTKMFPLRPGSGDNSTPRTGSGSEEDGGHRTPKSPKMIKVPSTTKQRVNYFKLKTQPKYTKKRFSFVHFFL